MGAERVAILGSGPHDEDADDGGEDPDRRDDQRVEDGGRRVVEAEGGVTQDQCGDDRDLVRLEEVGCHTGAVAHVVAHVVGDRRGVAGIVLGDPRLDFAHEVGADIGRLGEDAAADSHEEGEQRGAEGKPDQHRRGRVLKDEDDGRGADEAQAHTQHAGDGTGPEGDPQCAGHAAALGCRSSGAHVAAHGDAHADEAGQPGEGGAEEEADHTVEAVLRKRESQDLMAVRVQRQAAGTGLDHFRCREEDQDGQRDDDHRDGPELPTEEHLAPSWTAWAISRILREPWSAASTLRARSKPAAMPTMPA